MIILAKTNSGTFYDKKSVRMGKRNNCVNASKIPHLGILSMRGRVQSLPGPIVTVMGNCTVNNNRILRIMYSLAVTSRGTVFKRANPGMNDFSTKFNSSCLTHVMKRGGTHRV